jgi:hypothetical protein
MPDPETSSATDGLLSVGDLVRLFEESEDATYTARKDSERDRDYVDNKQLTHEELDTLKKRGQPPVIDNRIKTKIDYLVGLEKQQGVMPKAMPRTPVHESDADACTEALRYVAEEEDFASKRSGVWRNMLVEGSGGLAVSVEQATDYTGRPGLVVKLKKIAWDRMFADPHSSEPDYEDAGYKGLVTWMDYDDALALYPEGKDALDATLAGSPSDTYDDKPKYSLWGDKKRKRVRICQIWIKRDGQWYFAEYTKGGILKAGPSPHVTDKGESDDELVFQSAYVDRDNNRYGLVREMITLQDEINKRRSKSLHLLSVNQTIYEDGAVDDVNEFRRQKAKADGLMKVAPGTLKDNRLQTISGLELAAAQMQLLQEAKNAIDLKGPNATEMGDKSQGSNAASGKAIIASQQGGMIQIGDLLAGLRHLDKRVFRKIWYRIRQYWTAEKWIRVTDDEENIKWLGINVDPQRVQMLAMQNPQIAQKIAGAVGNLAELDCDIIIDDAPDSLTPQLEQFQALVELKKFDAGNEIPFRAVVAAMPNLKDKQAFLKAMDQAQQQRGQQQQVTSQLQLKGAMAEVDKTQSETMLNVAKAQELGQPDPQQPGKFELPPELQIAKAASDIDAQRATTVHKQTLTALAPIQAAHDINMDRANFVQGAREAQANRERSVRVA